MKKNKINGVRPFNDFFFRSCYYHQLMAGIACFGIDRDAILLNAFTLIQNNFNAGKEGFLNVFDYKIPLLLSQSHYRLRFDRNISSHLFPQS